MRRDSRFGSALTAHVSRYGLESFLGFTRTLVALIDAQGRALAANPAFETLSAEQSPAESILGLVAQAHRSHAQQLIASAVRDRKRARGQLEFGSENKILQYDCLFVPAEQGAALLFAEPIHVEAQLLSANEELASELSEARFALAEKTDELHAVMAQADVLAATDSLTFLRNRRSIITDLQQQVTYAERYGTPLAVSMMDIDGFKSVNDSSGHPAGDKILGMVARALRDRIRQPDEIGRYGGDEFLVILPNSTAVAASEQAARLCQHVRSNPIPFGGTIIQLGLSAGIAQHVHGVDTWQSLLERADRALYEAKRLGGNQWLILES